MKNNLIKVDIFDNKIGTISKEDAHKMPILHRAFSVFLYNKNKMLIQKRAKNKYHSGGLWANTCCSHPRTDNIIEDAKIRLLEEVGIDSPEIKELFTFTYLSKYSDNLYEYEYDHVLVGEFFGTYKINKEEVEDLKWIDIDKLANDIVNNPNNYATWFIIAAPKVINYIKNKKQS